jgi:ribosome-associated protein
MTKANSETLVLQDIPNATSIAPPEQLAASLQLAKTAARAAAENKGQDIVLLDVSKQTSIFDCFVIATGTSRRQLHAISDEIDHALEALGERRMSTSGYDESRWIVLDYGGLVIHLFDEDTRAFYDLEGLWADSPRVDLTEALKNTGAAIVRSDS